MGAIETATQITVNEINDQIIINYLKMVFSIIVSAFGSRLTIKAKNEIIRYLGIIITLIGATGVVLSIQLLVELSKLIPTV